MYHSKLNISASVVQTDHVCIANTFQLAFGFISARLEFYSAHLLNCVSPDSLANKEVIASSIFPIPNKFRSGHFVFQPREPQLAREMSYSARSPAGVHHQHRSILVVSCNLEFLTIDTVKI